MKWRLWVKRRGWERQMDAEFQFHLDNQIRDYMRAGLSREEAELHARREFGALELAKDECRDERPLEVLDHAVRDVRYAFRSLRKSPVLAAAAIMTLALGIGANTAIFSVFDSVVLAPLPYHEPDRLVLIALYNRTLKSPTALSYPDFLDWLRGSRSFEQMAAYTPQGFDLSNPGTPEHLNGDQVSSTFFGTLGTKFALGRNFSLEDDRYGGLPAVVISNRLWRDRFSRSPAALGKPVTLNGVDYTVVGVLPPDFRYGDQQADVYTPIAQGDPVERNDRTIHNIVSIARLRPAVTIVQAWAEMNIVQQRIDQLNPSTERGLETYIWPLKQFFVGDMGGTLLLLLGAVGLVLLIACANVANLLLVRSATRTREFAVRLALGAGRTRIVGQLVTESVLLSLSGGIIGLALAKWGLKVLLAAAPGSLPRIGNGGVNASVLLFALGVSMVVGIVFGLLPALRSSNTDLQAGLKEGSRGSSGGHHRTQQVLVVIQFALVLVLLMGGSLLLRTIHNLLAINPGFQTRNIVTLQVGLSSSVGTSSKVRVAYQQLVERIRQIPGVEAADITALLPLSQKDNSGPFWIGSQQPASIAEIPRAVYYGAGPDYLRTMQIPLLQGRFLNPADNVRSELVVLIDTLLARTYFPGGNAVGHTITIPHWGAAKDVAARIVGVVGHVEHWGLDGAVSEKPQIYYSFYQLPDDAVTAFRGQVTLTVRSSFDSAAVLPAIKSAVYEAGSDQPIYNIRTMQELVSGSMGRQRFSMLLLVGFAILALLLACVGIYGVISYSMTQRVREFGIRMALGATRQDVLQMVIGQSLRLALTGVAIGAVAAFSLARLLSSFRLLYGVRASDPLAFVTASSVLLGAALLACYVPARRAAQSDPMIALRHE